VSAISESIVREYFELHGFFVRQQRKYISPGGQEDDEADFFVINPLCKAPADPLPFVLQPAHLAGIARAVVGVKGWHTETFTTARLSHAPAIFRFVEKPSFQKAVRAFGQNGPLMKILVVPALPPGAQARNQSIEMLRAKGIDAVINFRTLLADLIEQVESNRNYQKSDLLQVLRILKNYNFFKEPQLELFKPRRKRQHRTENNT